VNLGSGASSCISALTAFFLVVFVLSFFTPWLALLPKACVACVVLSAIVRLVDVSYVQRNLW
jgi:MFS superfamily sulfate permease-like transporter